MGIIVLMVASIGILIKKMEMVDSIVIIMVVTITPMNVKAAYLSKGEQNKMNRQGGLLLP